MRNEHPVEVLVRRYGSQTGLADALGISPQAVGAWRLRKIPAERVLDIERITGVPRTVLRPDLYPDE